MTLYLIRSSLCLLTLIGAYHFLLEKEKMFRFNRVYLLFSLVFSFMVPFLTVHTQLLQDTAQYFTDDIQPPVLQAAPVAAITPAATQAPIPWMTITFAVYAIIALAFLIRFARNLYLITSRIAQNPKQKLGNANLILVHEPVVSHTFLRSIFVNEKEFNTGHIEPEVMMHELAHVRQLHTLDILLIEAVQAIFWFNPILILYRRAIQLNHEFLADEAVVDKFGEPKEYQYLLLQKVGPAQHLTLSSPLNYCITKKRLIMIAQNTNRKIILLKKISLAPLLAAAIFAFSTPGNAQGTGLNSVNMYIDSEGRGKSPYVLIDGKEYPSSVLDNLSPSCIRSQAEYTSASAIRKFGPKAANGAVVITTFNGKIVEITPIERSNRELERAGRTGFFHRIVLKKEDGRDFDKFFVNFNHGAVSASGDHNSKVAFLVDDKLFTEDQIGQVQKLVESMPNPGNSGVGGPGVKKIPGLDLSSYDVVFYFDSKK